MYIHLKEKRQECYQNSQKTLKGALHLEGIRYYKVGIKGEVAAKHLHDICKEYLSIKDSKSAKPVLQYTIEKSVAPLYANKLLGDRKDARIIIRVS